MSNFVTHYHKENILKTFQAYSSGLADCYYRYHGASAKVPECEQIIGSFFETCRVHNVAIMDAVASEIVRYMNYYGVQPRDGVDEFKLIYFMGMRLAAFLEREGNVTASKVIKYSAVLMLDDRLKEYTDNRGRPELKERLTQLIRDGKLEEKLGTDGLYLIYKCSANMLKEVAEQDRVPLCPL